MAALRNIWRLGVKELWSLWRDPLMLLVVAYTFTVVVYVVATALPDVLHKVPVTVVDEDHSPLSQRIVAAFRAPDFVPDSAASLTALDAGMDTGDVTLGVVVPAGFQRDLLRGRRPALQLDVDATRMMQAFSSASAGQQILLGEVDEFLSRTRESPPAPVDLDLRVRFNPNLEQSWFGSVMELVNMVTMLSSVLTGAALIREREHGTIEHLLVMPVTPAQIMFAKIWSMELVVLLATTFSLGGVIRGALHMPIEGSASLFMGVTALFLFSTTAMGIFLATLARTMPQFGLLLLLILLPLQLLSGGMTPRESQPAAVRWIMEAAPTTHFVACAQAILYRGAGLAVIWPHLLAIGVIGALFLAVALARFRRTLSQLA